MVKTLSHVSVWRRREGNVSERFDFGSSMFVEVEERGEIRRWWDWIVS